MTIIHALKNATIDAVNQLFGKRLPEVEINPTRKDQNGHYTIMVFAMLRHIKGSPAEIGDAIGAHLTNTTDLVVHYEVIKGFLNIQLSPLTFAQALLDMQRTKNYGFAPDNSSGQTLMVEYSSPNTNKPLHLGHVRNNLLGNSVAKILQANGHNVLKTQIINDRGIHICKSMLAWQKYGEGKTPSSEKVKGDKFVGGYYVKFNQAYKKEMAMLMAEGHTEDEAKKKAPLMQEAQEMLRKWEAGDEEVVALWKKMNAWVYDGFEVTYNTMGVDFDHLYYESNTYLLGKDLVETGLQKGIFFKKEDGSVWIDLSEEGLDEKLVLRGDGTSVYMTQDIGTAVQRAKDHHIDGMVYTVGNEQDYHFKVLFLILKKLGYNWASDLYHLSYGMVELPSGKMKSREGTVVDADDLMDEMFTTAQRIAQEQGKLDGLDEQQKKQLYQMIGIGALKYFMLKVDPVKGMLFDPEDSVDFQGNTGPFIQYAHARIQSMLKKADFNMNNQMEIDQLTPSDRDMQMILLLQQFPGTVKQAGQKHSPALIANYLYDLVKHFNSYYQNVPKIIQEEHKDTRQFRLSLCHITARVIKDACGLLGIEVPDQM